jgi:hypothetical protein
VTAGDAELLGEIRVDTVALGTRQGVPNTAGLGGGAFVGFGLRAAAMPPDVEMLTAIAEQADGHVFVVRRAARLDRVYSRLGATILRRTSAREIASWFAGSAAVALLAALVASRRLAPTLP